MAFHITVGSSDTVDVKQLLFQDLVDLSRYLQVISICIFNFCNYILKSNVFLLITNLYLQWSNEFDLEMEQTFNVLYFHMYIDNYKKNLIKLVQKLK